MSRTSGSLDRSLIHGLAWTGGVRWLTQLLSWGITIVVARILTPADYGLAGMAAIYTGFTLVICEGGLSAALLRRRDNDPEALAQLGGFALVLGTTCFLVSLALATPIAWAFGEPAVATVVMVSGIGFIPRGAQVLPRGLLARELDFRTLAVVDGIEALALALSTLTLALLGSGVWALVGGSLTGGIVGALAAFWWSPHRLAWPRHFRRIAADVIFSGKVLGAQLAWYIYNNADFAAVGRVLGTGPLGAYTLGWSLANVPADRVSSLLSRVTPAYFAAMSEEREELRRYVLRISEGLAILILPACLGLALVAKDLVLTMLGPGWAAAIVPLQLLAVISAVRALFVLGAPILNFTGLVDRNLRFSILLALILPPAFFIAAHWGIVAVAGVWVVLYPALTITFLFRHALRIVGVSGRDYFNALRAPILAASLMTLAVIAVPAGPAVASTAGVAALGTLIAKIVVGGVVYSAAILLLAGDRIRLVIGLLRGKVRPVMSRAPSRLLVVSYHFPPDPAVGALRWRKLARHAAARGWALDILALDPDSLPRTDPEGLADLPNDTRVHHIPAPDLPLATLPGRVWNALGRWRRNGVHGTPRAESCAARDLSWWPTSLRDLTRHYFAWLDHLRGRAWGRSAARRAEALVESGEFAGIVSCGPPHPLHPPILELAQRTGLPFILDLRDPWGLLQRLPEAVASPIWFSFARREEARCVAGAVLVLTSTDQHRDALRRRYPEAEERIVAVRNGCDDEPFPQIPRTRRFTVRYAGSIYLDRDPRPLFRAAARLIASERLTPDDFALEFMGAVTTHDGVPLEELARRAGVAPFVRCEPPRPRAEALRFQAGASMLALLPQDSDLAIPAKVFEYLRYPAWILALAEPGSATAELLAGSGADVVSGEDMDAIFAILSRRIREHRAGVRPQPVGADRRFARALQAQVLFDALAAAVSAPPPRPSTLTLAPPAEAVT
jgi:O-antigen/teichoic acid export membrane protein/glycosyltransferase involved in cell wall biosynthesis